MSDGFLPYGRQEISSDDVAAVSDALRSPLITQGPLVPKFEQAVAEYVGASHAVAFANGTAGLHAAAYAAGLGPDDIAVTSPITFAASANCALYQGASPRFEDIGSDWNLDCAAVVENFDEATRAIVPISFAGLPSDLGPLDAVRSRAVVIEDAAHAIGARRGQMKVGGPGGADMTVFSFHPVKAMTTGEGGIVTTEDPDLAAKLRAFRTHGITKEGIAPGEHEGDWYYEMQLLGFNYRITDIQCALGLSQLPRLDSWVERRNEIATRYREALGGDERLGLPPAAPSGSLHAYHLFIVQVLAGAQKRREVFDALRAAGIGVQVHYIPVYRLPYYRDTVGAPQDACPRAEEYYWRAISLPIFPAMEDGDVDRVVRELQHALD